MSEVLAPLHCTPFDPRRDHHCFGLADLYLCYLTEEYGRTGREGDGHPVGSGMKTYLFLSDGRIVGFCAVDVVKFAVELIYVKPGHRRQGIGKGFLSWLGSLSPTPVRLKPPLSPSSAALAESLGLEALRMDDDEIEARELLRGEGRGMSLVASTCSQLRHKRGNPARACRRCCQRLFTRMAAFMVGGYARTLLTLPSHERDLYLTLNPFTHPVVRTTTYYPR